MGRLQTIQHALISINETVFQDLCDSFLFSINGDYTVYSRTGSQEEKQKTKKGTPDSFFRNDKGKYIFVEYSTNITSGISKLKDDIEKCIDVDKTGIPIQDIETIILCFNFNLKPDEVKSLCNVIGEARIKLILYSLDSLSLELCLNHRDLVHDYLNISFDTGQIVSIEKFVEEYDKASKGIATPLNNPFVHREKELKELKEIISRDDLIILYGAPGVGKTKLALETIKDFAKENGSYEAYCISYKSSSLIEDLYQYLNEDKDYILFVDDANRIDSLGQVLGVYKASRKGKLKILMTVRDYAYNILEKSCREMQYESYEIKGLTDEQIIDIVKASPFEILNSLYHKEIIRIADGNPRLAIMAGLVAIEKQSLQVFHDSSDLFEKYFATFVNDDGEFAKSINLKILGLIAYFYTLPYKNKDVITPILDDFEIEYNAFIEQIDILERLELVEIQYEYVKIPEQNLSTFFFYKVFIKDELLSFNTLLEKYFRNNKERFEDCIIPANNTFGYNNVRDKVKPALKRYLESLKDDEEQTLVFLLTFCFYLQEETLGFICGIVEQIPVDTMTQYVVSCNEKDYLHNNRVIELLGKLFHDFDNLKDVVELSFEYVRRQAQHLPELISKVKSELTFKRYDESYGFKRQHILYEILIKGVSQKDTLYTKSFYELSKTFLSYKFEQTEAGRNRSYSFYYYPLPCNEYIKELRKKIWECIDSNFTEDAFPLLENYISKSPDIVKELMEYDIPFVCTIIESHLSPNSLSHCKYVHNQIRWCKRSGVVLPCFEHLSKTYTSTVYEMYLKINWDRLRDKESYEFDDNTRYEELKEREVRESFVFENKSEVDSFYNDFISIINTEEDNKQYQYRRVIDIVIDQTFSHSFELGLYFLEIIKENNPIGYTPDIAFKGALSTEDNVNNIWEEIQGSTMYPYKEQWEMSFYHHLREGLIYEKYTQAVKSTVSKWNSTNILNIRSLIKFFDRDLGLLEELLEIIVKKNDDGENVCILDYALEELLLKILDSNIGLIKRVYIQQAARHRHFDFGRKFFLSILRKDQQFLVEYIEALYLKKNAVNRLDDESQLSVIWQIDNIETALKEIFDIIVEKHPYYGLNEHSCNAFFDRLEAESKERAVKFLLDYCRENYNNPNKVNVVIDVANNSLKELYEEIVLLYISLTQNPEDFSRIHWCEHEGMFSGDDIIGDIEAAKWNKLLLIVNKSDVGYKLIPIKRFINNQIEYCEKSAEREKRERFIERRW